VPCSLPTRERRSPPASVKRKPGRPRKSKKDLANTKEAARLRRNQRREDVRLAARKKRLEEEEDEEEVGDRVEGMEGVERVDGEVLSGFPSGDSDSELSSIPPEELGVAVEDSIVVAQDEEEEEMLPTQGPWNLLSLISVASCYGRP
jgi:hypothetical protein